MNTKMLVSVASLGVASFLMLSGFSGELTAEEIIAKSMEAGRAENTVEADLTYSVGINIKLPALKLDVATGTSGEIGFLMTQDALSFQADGNAVISATGENKEIASTAYGVIAENGTFPVYVKAINSDDWYTHVYAKRTTDLTKKIINTDYNFADYGMEFTLSDELAKVDGHDCYEITTVVDWDILSALYAEVYKIIDGHTESVQLPDPASMAAYARYLEGVQGTVVYYVDSTTFLPVSMYGSTDGTDWEGINQSINVLMGALGSLTAKEGEAAAPVEEANINLPVYFDLHANYDTDAQIVIPEDVQKKAVSNTAGQIYNKVVNQLKDVVSFLKK